MTLHDYPALPRKDTGAAQVLASVQTSWRITQQVMASIPSRYRIWFTEFNLARGGRSRGSPALGATWLHGLYVATMMALFDESPRVQLDDFWDLFSNAATGAYTSGPDPQPTVAGVALMFLTNASATAYRITPLHFLGAPTLPDGATGVIGVSFSGSKSTRTVVINLTDHRVRLPTGAGTGLSAGESIVMVSGAPTTTVSGLARAKGVLSTETTLPAYAIAWVGSSIPPIPSL